MHLREADEGGRGGGGGALDRAYADDGPEGRQEPYALQEYFAVAASAHVTVAVDGDGEVVAVAALFAPGAPGAPGRSVAEPGEAEFARLAVADRARRQGAGRALVLAATERARRLGAERIALWSRPYQTAAHALYESLGWRRVPGRDGEDREGRRLVFVLDL